MAPATQTRRHRLSTEIAKAIVDGVLTGGVYALMAAGLTLIFGVMQIINIAQGIFVVLAAYMSYVLQTYLHIDPFVGLIFTMPLMFIIGVVIEWGFIRRLKPQNRTALSILSPSRLRLSSKAFSLSSSPRT